MRVIPLLCTLLFAPIAWTQAGPPPRTLTPRTATVARTPPRPPGPELNARLTSAWGDVTVTHGHTQQPAVGGATLSVGTRVRVGRGGEAEVTLHNGTIVTLTGRAEIVMFNPLSRGADRPPMHLTLLRYGSARFRRGDVTAQRPPFFLLSTGPSVVSLGRADGELTTDLSGRVTRVGVTRGRLPVRTHRGTILLLARRGALLAPYVRAREATLPGRPVWTVAPPARVVTAGAPVDVTGEYRLPSGSARRWRVELARDEAFRDRVSVTTAAGRVRRLRLREVAPGRYFVRVSALNEDGLAGPASDATSFTVAAPTIVAGGDGRRAGVAMPEGFLCAVDEGPLARVEGPIALSPARPHTVRCASSSNAETSTTFTVPAESAGPIAHHVRLYVSPEGGGVLGLSLHDAAGLPLPYADVRAEVDGGVRLEPLRESERRGEYTAALRWPSGLPRAHLQVTVNGVMRFDETLTP
jgi:hypothetical protein